MFEPSETYAAFFANNAEVKAELAFSQESPNQGRLKFEYVRARIENGEISGSTSFCTFARSSCWSLGDTPNSFFGTFDGDTLNISGSQNLADLSINELEYQIRAIAQVPLPSTLLLLVAPVAVAFCGYRSCGRIAT
jgi:hypothetical protein